SLPAGASEPSRLLRPAALKGNNPSGGCAPFIRPGAKPLNVILLAFGLVNVPSCKPRDRHPGTPFEGPATIATAAPRRRNSHVFRPHKTASPRPTGHRPPCRPGNP